MNILFIGDIVGKVGKTAISQNLNSIKKKYNIDFVIANAENVSYGRGMTKDDYFELKKIGIDCITLGNHYADRQELNNYIDLVNDIIRPANLNVKFNGPGSILFEFEEVSIRVTNLLGTAFMKTSGITDPYEKILEILSDDTSDIHIIDYHGEATGEKKAFAYALGGSVSCVLGTHTHVQTNDAQILDNGTMYISDVGMCGSYNSVLGSEYNSVVERVIKHNPEAKMLMLDEDDSLFNAVVLKFDDHNYKPIDIIPLSIIKRMK